MTRPRSRAPGSIRSSAGVALTVPSSPTLTPNSDSMTRLAHAPDDEQAQSIRYGGCGGALRAPPPSRGSAPPGEGARPEGPRVGHGPKARSQSPTTAGRPPASSALAPPARPAGNAPV